MKKTIYKYPLTVTDVQRVILPAGAEILTIQAQNELLYLWALIDTEEIAKQEVVIEIFGTGHDINYAMGTSRNYISTFQLQCGGFVGHAFLYTGI